MFVCETMSAWWNDYPVPTEFVRVDHFKGPYADYILIPQGATGSSAVFGVK